MNFFLNEKHPSTRQIKYKVIDFARLNEHIKMAKKILLTNLERLLRIYLRLRANRSKWIEL